MMRWQRAAFQAGSAILFKENKEQVAPGYRNSPNSCFCSEMTTAQEKLYEKTKSAARNEILSLFGDPQTRFQALQALTHDCGKLRMTRRLVNTDFEGGSGKV